MNYKSYIEKTLHAMRQIRTKDSIELQSLPSGNLVIYKDGLNYKYIRDMREKGVRKRRGVARNRRMLQKLARKRFLKERAALLDADIKVLSDACRRLKGYGSSEILSLMPPLFRTLPQELFRGNTGIHPHPVRDQCVPIMMIPRSLDDYPALTDPATDVLPAAAWGALPYRENTKYIEQKTVITEYGLLARSKSEADFIELYTLDDILFHYDEVFAYMDRSEYDPQGTLRYISPDFVLLRPDGSFLFHEHFGLTDDPEYMEKNLEKLWKYIKLGIMPGRDLMITFERPGGGIDMNLVRAKLDSMYYRR